MPFITKISLHHIVMTVSVSCKGEIITKINAYIPTRNMHVPTGLSRPSQYIHLVLVILLFYNSHHHRYLRIYHTYSDKLINLPIYKAFEDYAKAFVVYSVSVFAALENLTDKTDRTKFMKLSNVPNHRTKNKYNWMRNTICSFNETSRVKVKSSLNNDILLINIYLIYTCLYMDKTPTLI